MAIIDAKRLEADEEADRQARTQAQHYAQRHDSLWQQPPPAYEEAATSSSTAAASSRSRRSVNAPEQSSSAAPPERPIASPSSSQPQDGPDVIDDISAPAARSQSTNSRRARSTEHRAVDVEEESGGRRREEDESAILNDDESDELSPLLLTRRERYLLKKRLNFMNKYRRACRFMTFLLLSALFAMMVFSAWKTGNTSSKMPNTWDEDGRPVEEPKWSETVEAPPETWISPSIPVYTSTAWFSFPADLAALYVRAHGSSYTGVISQMSSDELSDKRWAEIHGGKTKDRVAIQVEARFTHTFLRDSVRINKMRDDRLDKKHVAEGLAMYADTLPTTGTSFISFFVDVFLSSPRLRSAAGRALDNSSYFPNVEIVADNMRITHEAEPGNDPKPATPALTFGKLDFVSLNGGVTITSPLLANDSIRMVVGNGHIRDLAIGAPTPIVVAAPDVDLSTSSGPIWLSGVVASDVLSIHTAAGGLNSSVAVSRKIYGGTGSGIVGGTFAALDELHLETKTGEVSVDVKMATETYSKMVTVSGLRALLGPNAPTEEEEARTALQAGPWRICRVDVKCSLGGAHVHYSDQDERTQLDSTVASSTGSASVSLAKGFQGKFELHTKIGSISIAEPDQHDPTGYVIESSKDAKKTFVIDREERWRMGEKLVKGRLWYDSHKWEEGGSGRGSAFPVSSSLLRSDYGSLLANFS